jgi:hypothetical protein
MRILVLLISTALLVAGGCSGETDAQDQVNLFAKLNSDLGDITMPSDLAMLGGTFVYSGAGWASFDEIEGLVDASYDVELRAELRQSELTIEGKLSNFTPFANTGADDTRRYSEKSILRLSREAISPDGNVSGTFLGSLRLEQLDQDGDPVGNVTQGLSGTYGGRFHDSARSGEVAKYFDGAFVGRVPDTDPEEPELFGGNFTASR